MGKTLEVSDLFLKYGGSGYPFGRALDGALHFGQEWNFNLRQKKTADRSQRFSRYALEPYWIS